MTFHEIINLHPHPSDVDRNLLLRCIEECLDCAASCTACADACLGESELAELRGCVRLNLDCADACEATGRIVTRQTSPDLRLIKATVEACAVACLACAAPAWSIYGAKRAQPVATGRKSKGRENGSNRPIGNRWQPTATVPERMVRRGSTVRVRQRASGSYSAGVGRQHPFVGAKGRNVAP